MQKFEYSPAKYNFIINNLIFNEPKKEREVFEMATKGYNNTEIAYVIGMSDKTVYRRKKEINKKIYQLFN